MTIAMPMLAPPVAVASMQITVMNGYRAQQLSVGFLDKFLNVAERQIGPLFEDLVPEEEEEYQRRLAKWKEEMAEYERQYGPMPAEVRRRAETSLQPQDRTVQQWPQQQQQGRQADATRRREDRERDPPRGQQVCSLPETGQRAHHAHCFCRSGSLAMLREETNQLHDP